MIDTISAVAAEEHLMGPGRFEPGFRMRRTFACTMSMRVPDRKHCSCSTANPPGAISIRHQIPVWAERHRVIAVDHMGFGKSATPQDRTYWLQDHIDNLERFVRRARPQRNYPGDA